MERRSLDFTSFDELLADVDELHKSGYTKAGEWSLAQNLQHLRFTMESATQDKNMGIPRLLKWILRITFLKKVLETRVMKPGYKTAKVLMPTASSEQSDTEQEKEEVEAFRSAVKTFSEHKGEYLPNPAFGKLDRDDWQDLQLIHCSHHLSFLIPN